MWMSTAYQFLSVATFLHGTALRRPSLAPRHSHFVAERWMIGLELGRSFRKANNDSVDSAADNAHHDGSKQETNQESQTVGFRGREGVSWKLTKELNRG